MEIKFNMAMDTARIKDLSWINKTMMDIYVEPSQERFKFTDTIDMSKLNLTWKPVKYENKNLFIQLNFTDPIFISPHEIQDKIVVHLNNASHSQFFKATDSNTYWNPNYFTLKSAVMKQMPNNALT